MKKLLCILSILMLLVTCLPMAALADQTAYVNTPNGKSLNVRSAPEGGKNVIYRIKNGTKVTIFDGYLGSSLWVSIHVSGHEDGYVQAKFLSTTKPTVTPSTDDLASELNFRSFKLVTPFTVYTNPSRVGGTVNFRWAPSTNCRIIKRLTAGEELTVISEGTYWYQAKDSEGYVGFIYKKFTTEAN